MFIGLSRGAGIWMTSIIYCASLSDMSNWMSAVIHSPDAWEARTVRNTQEGAAESRERILAAAARLFRSEGIAAVAVGDVMRAAGMTHGGFYKHFDSKEALVAEACEHALAETRERMRARAEQAKPGQELKAIVDSYLSDRHRGHPGHGCAIAALGGEVGRGKGRAKKVLAEGRASFAALIARYWPGAEAEANASAVVSSMVGAMISARIAGDDGGEVLRAARRELHRRVDAAKKEQKRRH
jgi:TetR/AcrR family transcriptional regulator, transcriptional repressor for nem operon